MSLHDQMTDRPQIKYYGMETGNRKSTSFQRGPVAVRIPEIPVIARVQITQSKYNDGRIQKDLLHGMDTSALGTRCWHLLCAPGRLLDCSKASIKTDDL